MKSLNAKKIAAAAAGGALIAAAFAGAVTVDPAVGNYQFFNNGKPNVGIVVGSKAQIWDGIAAANIAAMVGNLAYSTQTVVAGGEAPSGSASPSAGGVTGKSVTADFTSPSGATGQSGSAVLSTQLYDFLDNDVKTATINRDDDTTSGLVGDGITTGGYFISHSNYPDVAFEGTIQNLGTYSVLEDTYYYVTAVNYFDTTSNTLVADRMRVNYAANFTNPIPYHIDIVNGSTSGRDSNDNKITMNRNIIVRFMGTDYVLTDFQNGSATTNPSISLGAAAVFRQLKAGDTVLVAGKTVKLLSISPIATGSSTQPSGSFEVDDASGARLDYFTLQKGSADYNKNGIILHIRDIFVGGGDSSYGDVAVYASSITLQNGQKITFNGDDTSTALNNNVGWTTTLTFGDLVVGTDDQKTLKQIMLISPTSTRMQVGQPFNVIAAPVFKTLTFLGMEPVDKDTLKVIAYGRQTATRVTNFTGDPNPTGSNVDINVTRLVSGYSSAFNLGGKNYNEVWIDKYNGRFIVYDSTSSQANYTETSDSQGNAINYYYPSTTATNAITLYTNFTRPGPLGVTGTATGGGAFNITDTNGASTYLVSYNDTSGGESLPTAVSVANGTNLANTGASLSWIAVPGASTYQIWVQNGSASTTMTYVGSTSGTTFNTSLSGGNRSVRASLNGSARSAYLKVFESVNDNQPTNLSGYWYVNLYPADANNLFNTTSSTNTILTTSYFTSASPGSAVTNFPSTSGTAVQQAFITPGGSVLQTLGLSEIDLLYPKRFVHARYQFQSPTNTTTNVTSGGIVTTQTLKEGAVYMLGNGYSVKINAISGSASCSAATSAAACTPATAAVVTPLDTSVNKLVMLDTDATGTGQMIVVGGPIVNTVAANTPGVMEVTGSPGNSVVKVIGGKVIVAGYTAQDTQDAANALISWLAQNRDTVRGQ